MAGFPLPLDYGMACVRAERREDRQESESDAMIAQVLFLKGPAGRRTVVQETREGDMFTGGGSERAEKGKQGGWCFLLGPCSWPSLGELRKEGGK